MAHFFSCIFCTSVPANNDTSTARSDLIEAFAFLAISTITAYSSAYFINRAMTAAEEKQAFFVVPSVIFMLATLVFASGATIRMAQGIIKQINKNTPIDSDLELATQFIHP